MTAIATTADLADLPPEADPLQHDVFWSERESLHRIRAFAYAQGAAPSAVLTFSILRAIAATPHNVKLPPTIGSPASLNLFAAMVGRSGGGKGIARGVAKRATEVPGTFAEAPLGSGEGLVKAFARNQEIVLDTGEKVIDLDWKNRAIMLRNDEVSGLEALFGRSGSTLGAQLKQAAMGEPLGFGYADDTKSTQLPEHSYRLTLDVAVQPALSGAMFRDAEGGFPQRFVWAKVTDPSMLRPKDRPRAPQPWVMRPTDWGVNDVILDIPTEATDEILQANWERQIEAPSDLDGHALLTRLKVATGLALLDNRHGVDVEDWGLAECLMMHSAIVRAECMRAEAEQDVHAATKRGQLQAVTRFAAQDATDSAMEKRERDFRDKIERYWRELGCPSSWSPVRNKVWHKHRPEADKVAMDLAAEIPGFPSSDYTGG